MAKHGQPTVRVKPSIVYVKACSPNRKTGFFNIYTITLIFF